MQYDIDRMLDKFAHFGVDLGLDRIKHLLNQLGNPHQQVPIVHVAGSNGKGSVCAYLSTVLSAAGYRVGRYISPHLVAWNERICINNEPITDADLSQVLSTVIEAIAPPSPSPTQFEVITAAAWLYFAQQRVDIAVIEVGLGGRLDATNVCDRPLVSIITSLSREHWQRLGPTLADISREKAGILKPGCPAVIAPLPDEATPVIQRRLWELKCPAVFPKPSMEATPGWVEYQSPTIQSASPSQEERSPLLPPHFKYPLALVGEHQKLNSALAIAALECLHQQGWTIPLEAIQTGMANTRWLGRLQWIDWNNQPLLIDGAHNPAGAEMLRKYLDRSDRVSHPIHWVMGMLNTKDHAEIFQALLRAGDRLYLVPVPDHLSADCEALRAIAQENCPALAACYLDADVMSGMHHAFQHANSQTPAATVVLCGSLYLIGQFLRLRDSQ